MGATIMKRRWEFFLKILVVITVNIFVCKFCNAAGDNDYVNHAPAWKASLNFNFQNQYFNYIDDIHCGLSDAAQEKTEENRADSEIGGELEYDNIGNAFYINKFFYYPVNLGGNGYRSPINSENIALACLQIIFADSTTSFMHIPNNIGTLGEMYTRYFGSGANSSKDKGNSHRHLLNKVNFRCKSKPHSFKKEDLIFSHPVSHSEDVIYYNMNTKYCEYINFIRNKSQDKKIEGVILHMHTKFDMCGSCTYALDWEMKYPNGFADKIKNHCHELNHDKHISVHVSAMVSSRQGFLVWDLERRSLPSAPPAHYDRPYSDANYEEYKRGIELVADFSNKRTAALRVIQAFERHGMSEIQMSAYNFSKDAELKYIWGPIPPSSQTITQLIEDEFESKSGVPPLKNL